jgi:hypothetical protein
LLERSITREGIRIMMHILEVPDGKLALACVEKRALMEGFILVTELRQCKKNSITTYDVLYFKRSASH